MKINFALLAFGLLISSCQQTISGSGNIITDSRDVGSFHQVRTDIMSDVIIVQDSGRSYVEVHGYENLVKNIDAHVEDGDLIIESKDHFNIINNNLKITVHVPQLDQIQLSGVGSVKTESLFTFDHLRVKLGGVGSISLSGKANRLYLESAGVGSINTKELACDSVYAHTAGVGSISCNAMKYLSAQVSGVGSISYTGDPQVDKKITGVGSVKKSD